MSTCKNNTRHIKLIRTDNGVKIYSVEQVRTYEEVKLTAGQYYDKFSFIIDHDADVYCKDIDGNYKPLFFFRKGIIPMKYMTASLTAFKQEAIKARTTRLVAGGFKTHVKSMIAGFFDKPRRIKRGEDDNDVPCRTTAFTEKEIGKWSSVTPLIKFVDKLYKDFMPECHKSQLKLAKMTPEFQINNTAFSTITVNYNWRTACHVDDGDYRYGYSVIMAASEGEYDGGYLGYPQYNIGVNVRSGDFLLKDPHQFHANTPIVGITEDYTRLSMVLYYREGMQKCIGGQTSSKSIRKTTSLPTFRK